MPVCERVQAHACVLSSLSCAEALDSQTPCAFVHNQLKSLASLSNCSVEQYWIWRRKGAHAVCLSVCLVGKKIGLNGTSVLNFVLFPDK